MNTEYAERREQAAKDADWYLCRAKASTTEAARTWWKGFAKICRSDVAHYTKLLRKYGP